MEKKTKSAVLKKEYIDITLRNLLFPLKILYVKYGMNKTAIESQNEYGL